MPCAERVVEEEVDHVVFGEELRDRRQLVGANLHAGIVDLLLPLRLPELVGPAEGIAGGEDLLWKGVEEISQSFSIVRWKGKRQHRIVAAEHGRQRGRGKATGELEPILGPEIRRQLLAFLQGHGNIAVGLVGDEQVVLGQESGEQEPVPVLVGGVLRETLDFLATAANVPLVSHRLATRPQAIAELALLAGHVRTVVPLMHG